MLAFIQQFGGLFGLSIGVILGIIALIGYFDKTRRERNQAIKKDETETEDRVMTLLKEQVDALEKKVDTKEGRIEELENKVDELTKKVDRQNQDIRSLTEENHSLTKILQGRDDTTQQFYKDAYAAMARIASMETTVQHNDKVSESNAKTLAKIDTLLETVVKLQNK